MQRENVDDDVLTFTPGQLISSTLRRIIPIYENASDGPPSIHVLESSEIFLVLSTRGNVTNFNTSSQRLGQWIYILSTNHRGWTFVDSGQSKMFWYIRL